MQLSLSCLKLLLKLSVLLLELIHLLADLFVLFLEYFLSLYLPSKLPVELLVLASQFGHGLLPPFGDQAIDVQTCVLRSLPESSST